MLRRLNEGLPGLVLGIVLFGIIAEIPILIWAPDRVGFSIGLWYGVAIAIGSAVSLAAVIYDAFHSADEDATRKRLVAKSLLRYLVVAILLAAIGFLKFGNLVMAIAGVMGLKISAYAQPLLGRISRKLFGDNWMYPEDSFEEADANASESNASESSEAASEEEAIE